MRSTEINKLPSFFLLETALITINNLPYWPSSRSAWKAQPLVCQEWTCHRSRNNKYRERSRALPGNLHTSPSTDSSMSSYACFRPLALTTGPAYNKGRQFLSSVGCNSRQKIEARMNKYGDIGPWIVLYMFCFHKKIQVTSLQMPARNILKCFVITLLRRC